MRHFFTVVLWLDEISKGLYKLVFFLRSYQNVPFNAIASGKFADGKAFVFAYFFTHTSVLRHEIRDNI